MQRVRKAVLPVAGLGTRMLPAAKTVAKEMLTVVDRPLIHHVMSEARAAGIEHFVLVTGRGKGAMEDYFDHHVELEETLRAKNKTAILDELLADLPKAGEISYVRQMAPHGLGHAVWCARDIIGDEPFAVLLPDMIMDAEPGATAQAIKAFEQTDGGNIILVEPCPPGEAHKYGIVALDGQDGRLNRMTGMVEKPAPGTEPSNLFISGRYVLQPEIFKVLETVERGAGGEIQLTDAMAKLMGEQPFYALEYEGTTYDCGDKIGWLRANVALALKRPDLGEAARRALAPLFA
ncbi:UTP--glucose-1-phosphate uridylyltransferase [Caulobacter sp. S45]|uniref:UTP--glucose-1-phosphate uridylyltransferase n=1 Tax=Caulobacter sp. S45 TaxID=1641861 RepID=UPI00131EAFF6|nr:UTP--glucose-1-phosphate uridylyltransferase [Caulobacter sp. S45]